MAKRSKKKTKNLLESTWSATVEALAAAEAEIERQLKVLRKKKIGGKEAQEILQDLGSRVERERKRALKELESRAKMLQGRIEKERKALGRLVRDTVEG